MKSIPAIAIMAAALLTSCATQSATTTSPSPRPSPTGTASWSCVSSTEKGTCGPYHSYPRITGAASKPWAGNDVWNPVSGWHQTFYAKDPGDWQAVANMPANNTAVVSFPNTGVYYTGAVDSYSSFTSSFAEKMNATSATIASAAYDMWFHNSGSVSEVMITNDMANRGGCGTWAATNVRFGGSNGVPVRSWNLCQGTNTSWWNIADGNMNSGSVDILAMVKWLINHGHMAPESKFSSISYGFELCSTGGQNETFQVTNFTASAK